MDLGLCSEMLKSIRRLVLLMYIDNVYVLCFNIKVCLKGFSNVTCTGYITGYITYTMIGFLLIFEPTLIWVEMLVIYLYTDSDYVLCFIISSV